MYDIWYKVDIWMLLNWPCVKIEVLFVLQRFSVFVTTNICVSMFLCRCENKYMDITLLQPVCSVTTVMSWNNTATTTKCCNSTVTPNSV